MEQISFWEEHAVPNHLKYDNSSGSRAGTPQFKEELYRCCDSVSVSGNLNFSTAATSEDDDYGYHKKKMSRDPMSHRIIEKRRRDRMNNCLADLSRLIPTDYMKKGRGRIEKTEIIEMAIKHMKHLQDHHASCQQANCELDHHQSLESEESYSPPESNSSNVMKVSGMGVGLPSSGSMRLLDMSDPGPPLGEDYRLGYHECMSETMHFLVEVEGMFAGDRLCVQLISHLQTHCDKILKSGDAGHTTMSCSSKERSSGSRSGSDSGSGGERPPHDVYCSSSQLRDILTSNNQRLKAPEPSSPSNLTNGATSQAENHSSNSLYKFKNNIKQRFSAEHGGSTEQCHPISMKRRRSDEKRRRSETSSNPSPPPAKYHQPPTPSPTSPTPSAFAGVPVFALHSKGSFYIPLTIDYHILAPFLAELGTIDTDLTSIVLHPVTISVNFQRPMSRPPHQSLCSSQWSASPSTFLPLPKWSTCSSEGH